MKNNINVTIRMDKEKIERLKEKARERNYKEKINITYNDLIVLAVDREYFNGENNI